MRHAYLKLVLALLLCSSRGIAQNHYQHEVYGSIGFAKPVPFGDLYSANLGVGIGIRPFSPGRKKLHGFEFEFDVNAFKTEHSRGLVTETFVTGNLVYHFSRRRAQPYALVGLGRAIFTVPAYDYSYVSGATSYSFRVPEEHGGAAADIAFGVKIFLAPRVSVRSELRTFNDGWNLYATGSVAISYHW